jgi:hypothetical protein
MGVVVAKGYVPAHAAPPEHSRLHRVVVDLWYLPCVLLPLAASLTAPAWYVAIFDPKPHTVASAVQFLIVSWTPWVLAALGTIALAVKYELRRRPRDRNVANAWDRLAVRMLGITGAAGAIVSLVLTGVVLGVVPA